MIHYVPWAWQREEEARDPYHQVDVEKDVPEPLAVGYFKRGGQFFHYRNDPVSADTEPPSPKLEHQLHGDVICSFRHLDGHALPSHHSYRLSVNGHDERKNELPILFITNPLSTDYTLHYAEQLLRGLFPAIQQPDPEYGPEGGSCYSFVIFDFHIFIFFNKIMFAFLHRPG